MRPQHRTKLKNIIETVSWSGGTLPVSEYYRNSPPEGLDFPYVYITSSGLQNFDLISVPANYMLEYKYIITVVFSVIDENAEDIERQIDEIEIAITKALLGLPTRNDGLYLDLKVNDVSPVFSPEPEITENIIMKSWDITVQDVLNNPT
jgi:hypothetical protein